MKKLVIAADLATVLLVVHWVSTQTAAFIFAAMASVVIVASWFSPKPFRPWIRAALLMGLPYIAAPRSSVFMFLVWTVPFWLTAALIMTLRNPE